jgi:hypothetical protein
MVLDPNLEFFYCKFTVKLRREKTLSNSMIQQIEQIKVCAPRPERCEDLVAQTIPGKHEYDYFSRGRNISLVREIQSVNLYQEGEGSFAYAKKEGSIVVEQGDGISVHEYNHGSFNISYFINGRLQSQLTYVEERGGLTMLVNMIKKDAKFPNSIREIGDELIVNAIAQALLLSRSLINNQINL